MSVMSISDAKDKIQRFPKVGLIHLPTPFQKLENLTKAIDGPEIFFKRDIFYG